MPEDAKHIRQAAHNEEVLSLFSATKKEAYFGDWYVTIAFYTSLHYVEAIVFRKRKFNIYRQTTVSGRHSSEIKRIIGETSEHVVRNKLLFNNPHIFNDMYIPYGTLYEMSRVARYDCHDTPCNEYIDAELCLDKIKNLFKKIMKN